MKRFLFFAALLWSVNTALVAAVKFAFNPPPLSQSLRLLNLIDCVQPCWLGIKPGISTTTGAAQKIKHVYGNLTFGKLNIGTFPSGVRFLDGVTIIGQIYVTTNGSVVKEIRFFAGEW